ncbi:MAG: hypothetical protein DRJ63_09585 [Thermoprotei archaeon]|nr:MAG: hypothetical protein DRJ63_09585 [Thermoprotei archaeon]
MRNVVVIVRTRLKSLEVSFQGDKDHVKSAVNELRRILVEVKYKRRRSYEGYFLYNLRSILKSVSLDAAISINLALEVLRLKGFKVEVSKGFVKTDADYSTVIKVFEKLAKIYKDLSLMSTTPSSRKAIAYTSLLLDKNVDESIVFLKNNECINIIDGKIVLTKNLNEIKEIIKKYCA